MNITIFWSSWGIFILYCWNHSALGYLWKLTKASISRQDNQPCQGNRKRRESPGRKSCPRQNFPLQPPWFSKGNEEFYREDDRPARLPSGRIFHPSWSWSSLHTGIHLFWEIFFNNFSNKTWVKGGRMTIICYSPPRCLAPFPSCWNKSEKFPSFSFIQVLWMSVQKWI